MNRVLTNLGGSLRRTNIGSSIHRSTTSHVPVIPRPFQIPHVTKSYFATTPGQPPRAREVSPHIGFYQMFGRPIAKVFLIAMFTYQILYYGWMKLETVEEVKGRTEEVAQLESELQQHLQKTKS